MAPDWKLQIYNFVLKKQKNYHETRLEDILKNKIVAELFEVNKKTIINFKKKQKQQQQQPYSIFVSFFCL